MRKFFYWFLWFLIGGIAFVVGMNRLINALIHSKKDRTVPNIIGKNIPDSLDVLSSLNLYLKKTSDDFNPDVPAGLIISQAPPAGSIVKEGKTVNVVISAGGEIIFVPDLKNQTVRFAQLILRKSDLDIGEQGEKYSIEIEKGKIISQNPLPRTATHKNYLVNIVVSLGLPPEGVLIMPDFTKKNIVDAEDWAKQNDVKIKKTNTNENLSNSENTIIQQLPQPGETVKKGDTVELWISARNTEQTRN